MAYSANPAAANPAHDADPAPGTEPAPAAAPSEVAMRSLLPAIAALSSACTIVPRNSCGPGPDPDLPTVDRTTPALPDDPAACGATPLLALTPVDSVDPYFFGSCVADAHLPFTSVAEGLDTTAPVGAWWSLFADDERVDGGTADLDLACDADGHAAGPGFDLVVPARTTGVD